MKPKEVRQSYQGTLHYRSSMSERSSIIPPTISLYVCFDIVCVCFVCVCVCVWCVRVLYPSCEGGEPERRGVLSSEDSESVMTVSGQHFTRLRSTEIVSYYYWRRRTLYLWCVCV